MILIPDLIEEQPCWSIVVGDEKIRITIIINITERGATTNFQQRKLRSQILDNLNKTSFPRIAKDLIRLAQRKRIFLSHKLRQQLHRSVRDEQIKPAIVIVIKEERAKTREATTRHTEPRFACAIFEKRLAEVHVKCVGLVH